MINGRWKDNCFAVNLESLLGMRQASATSSQPTKHNGKGRLMKIRAQWIDSDSDFLVFLTVLLAIDALSE
jgi:hypothetical protein